jgi:hypothetical protein
MSVADMSVENFKGRLLGGGARNNLFKVIVTFDGINPDLFSFMCKGASLPGSEVATIALPFRGREIQLAGDRKFEQPWTVTVINDIVGSIKGTIEGWMHDHLNRHEQNTSEQAPASYKAVDCQVIQLRKDGSEIPEMSYTFAGIFPTKVSNIELTFSTEGAVEEFTVDFAYDYWVSATTV